MVMVGVTAVEVQETLQSKGGEVASMMACGCSACILPNRHAVIGLYICKVA